MLARLSTGDPGALRGAAAFARCQAVEATRAACQVTRALTDERAAAWDELLATMPPCLPAGGLAPRAIILSDRSGSCTPSIRKSGPSPATDSASGWPWPAQSLAPCARWPAACGRLRQGGFRGDGRGGTGASWQQRRAARSRGSAAPVAGRQARGRIRGGQARDARRNTCRARCHSGRSARARRGVGPPGPAQVRPWRRQQSFCLRSRTWFRSRSIRRSSRRWRV